LSNFKYKETPFKADLLYQKEFMVSESLMKTAETWLLKEVLLHVQDSHCFVVLDLWFRHEFLLLCFKKDCKNEKHAKRTFGTYKWKLMDHVATIREEKKLTFEFFPELHLVGLFGVPEK
jgi:hypothetical protein